MNAATDFPEAKVEAITSIEPPRGSSHRPDHRTADAQKRCVGPVLTSPPTIFDLRANGAVSAGISTPRAATVTPTPMADAPLSVPTSPLTTVNVKTKNGPSAGIQTASSHSFCDSHRQIAAGLYSPAPTVVPLPRVAPAQVPNFPGGHTWSANQFAPVAGDLAAPAPIVEAVTSRASAQVPLLASDQEPYENHHVFVVGTKLPADQMSHAARRRFVGRAHSTESCQPWSESHTARAALGSTPRRRHV